ncbi:MAG: rRNA pseudouridine synthase [Bacilli bacterium]|nr:rRNA pseudouridine synthase [Bacilli bacterium]
MERLQKVIASSGVCSRRKAEELIISGKVKVNGNVITELGTKVSSSDEVMVNNIIISKETKEYYLLNKPRGVITSTSDDKNRKTVVDLIDTNARIYPVGRLDYDTTGVLLLTNDGEFSNILMSPKNKVEKLYITKLKGIITGDAINKLKSGVVIDGIKVKPVRVKLKKVNKDSNTCIVEIIITEGKNHQVKKMFNEVSYEVLKLKREKVAFFELGNLASGRYRKLTTKEVARVYGIKKTND